jgi:hypothetical protein
VLNDKIDLDPDLRCSYHLGKAIIRLSGMLAQSNGGRPSIANQEAFDLADERYLDGRPKVLFYTTRMFEKRRYSHLSRL